MAATLLWVGGWLFPERPLVSVFLSGVPPPRLSRNVLSPLFWHQLARYAEHTDKRGLEYAFVVGLFVMALLAVAMAGPQCGGSVFLALVAGVIVGVAGTRSAKQRPERRCRIRGPTLGVAAPLGLLAFLVVRASPALDPLTGARRTGGDVSRG